MIFPESPKALAFDGSLAAWSAFAAAHFAAGMIWVLTITVLLLRAMILWRQWRTGK